MAWQPRYPSMSTKLLSAVLAATALPTLAVEIAAEYNAGIAGNPAIAANPTTQGWTVVNPTTDVANFASAAISPDGASGLNAWRMLDNSTAGSQFLYWVKSLTAAQLTNAMANGWRLVNHMRLADPVALNGGANSVYMYFANNAGKRWIIFFDLNASGQIVATLQGGSTVTLTGVDPTSYHTHEIVYDAASQQAEYLVDGVSKSSSWTGTTGTANGVRWGTESSGGRGDGYYNRVAFVINDPPPPPIPTVTTQPQSQSVPVGGNVTLTTAFANAVAPFRWFKDTVELPAQTAATLTLSNLTAADVGDYWCRATNVTGSASTQTAAVSVLTSGGGLVLNEFLAENDKGLRDSDGDRGDWIEIHNTSDTAQSTAGWFLTDDPALPNKWALSAESVPSGGFLLIWASGKSRAAAGAELHTNFSLQNSGGYLALVKPDLTVATAFTYPEQFADATYGQTVHSPPLTKFFAVATPNAPNLDGQTSVRDGITFSPAPGTFVSSVEVTASSTLVGGSLRLSTSGAVPEFDSPAFGPSQILASTTQLRAAVIYPNERYGATASGTFLKVAADAQAFTSPLPILVMSNHGAGAIPGVTARGPNGDGSQVSAIPMQAQSLTILDAATGDTAMNSPVAHRSRAGLKLRGSSSFTFAEKSYSLETWAERDSTERDVALLGMPADADWVIYGPDPGQFDSTLIHNTLTYELARLAGFNAPRHRFVELFIDTGGDLSMADHRGLAILVEKPSRGQERVDFSFPNNAGTTGGWMISVDRMDAQTSAVPVPRHFHTAGPDGILQTADDNPRGYQGILVPGGPGVGSGITPPNDDIPNFYHSFFNFEVPSAEGLTSSQRSVIQTSLRDFDTALYGSNYLDATVGYWPHIDVPNWARHLLIHCFVKNQDAIVLSSFLMRETPTAKIQWATLWDIDRSYDKNVSNGAGATTNLTWSHDRMYYRRLMTDPEFMQAYIDEWQRLRRGPWTNAAMMALVDAQVAEITSTVAARSGLTAGTWATNVATMKTWMTDRANAMDALYTAPPTMSHPGGDVASGYSLTMTGGPEIFFTVDGKDPRQRGGNPSATASLYTTALVITEPTIITARVRNGTTWSGLVSTSYYPPQDLSKLSVTEIYYNPPGQAEPLVDGDEFEFLELKNTGTQPLDVSGLSFSGLTFTFPPDTVITPGSFYVLVRNPLQFAERFPGCAPHGDYSDKLANGGETISLLQGGAVVWSVTFDDESPWRAEADNGGFSLQRPDPTAPGYDVATWTAAFPTPCADLSLADTDLDGMADYWEPLHGLIVGASDGTTDSDGDGASNAEEFLAGTDPRNQSSLLTLQATTSEAGTTLAFTAVAGKAYTVFFSADLQTWDVLQTVPAGPLTRIEQIIDPSPPNRRFYKAQTPPH